MLDNALNLRHSLVSASKKLTSPGNAPFHTNHDCKPFSIPPIITALELVPPFHQCMMPFHLPLTHPLARWKSPSWFIIHASRAGHGPAVRPLLKHPPGWYDHVWSGEYTCLHLRSGHLGHSRLDSSTQPTKPNNHIVFCCLRVHQQGPCAHCTD